jgi:hypothetical protein
VGSGTRPTQTKFKKKKIKGTVARDIEKLLISLRIQLEYLGMEEGCRPAVRMIGCHSCRLTHKVFCYMAAFFLHYRLYVLR